MKRTKHEVQQSKQQKLSFAPVVHSVPTIEEAVKCLTHGKRSTSKEKITGSLSVIENASSAGGISSENIKTLVDIIGSQKFGLQISKTLIKCLLLQKQDIPVDSIISAVSWICTQRLHLKIQVELLKWILQVYDTIKNKQNFSFLYGVLFNFLEYEELAPFVCQLLCKMTEKYHVVPFRVRHLLEILARLGPELHILVLLNTFAQYRQDLCTTQIRVQVMIREQIQTFSELHETAKNLNTGKGLQKLLSSPKRRILFTSGLSTSLLSHFSLWMRQSLATEKSPKENSLCAERAKLLILASDISEELQEGIPEVEGFVKAYLTKWNGHSHFDLLLDIIQYWKFCSFEILLEDVLLPIFKYFCGSSIAYKCSVLECYTKLYQRWALWEVQRHEGCRAIMTNNLDEEHQQSTVFGQELRSEYPYQEVESLATYIGNICIVSLQLHPDHPSLLLYHIMIFFEVVIESHYMNNAAPLILPPAFVICAATFSNSACAVSQMCGLIISYKEAVDNLRATNAEMVKNSWIDILNRCLLDICDTLWRCRAFQRKENSLLYFKQLPQHVYQSVSEVVGSFSLYHHPAFFGVALDFVHKSHIKVSLKELLRNETIRDLYLMWLSGLGLKSVIAFVKTFIKLRDDIRRTSE